MLKENRSMLRVFHKCGYPVQSRLEGNIYELKIPFTEKD